MRKSIVLAAFLSALVGCTDSSKDQKGANSAPPVEKVSTQNITGMSFGLYVSSIAHSFTDVIQWPVGKEGTPGEVSYEGTTRGCDPETFRTTGGLPVSVWTKIMAVLPDLKSTPSLEDRGLLGAGSFAFTVNYADGSSKQFTLEGSDQAADPAAQLLNTLRPVLESFSSWRKDTPPDCGQGHEESSPYLTDVIE